MIWKCKSQQWVYISLNTAVAMIDYQFGGAQKSPGSKLTLGFFNETGISLILAQDQ